MRRNLSAKFRRMTSTGNSYLIENYEKAIRSVFEEFELSFDEVNLPKGLSNDKAILSEVAKFPLI